MSSACTTSRRARPPPSRTPWGRRRASPSAGSTASDEGGVSSPETDPDTEVDASPQRAATYTDAFSRALLAAAEADPRVVALTAAMPGPTGLLPFQARFPDRFFDVGIAEQHEATAAAGMAMAGLRPVVAVYSTFCQRAFDQANLDVGLHGCPGRLHAGPGRDHRRRRAQPPRRARPGAGAVHPRHDRVRPLGGRRGRAHARDGSGAPGPLDHPLPQDGAAPREPRRGRTWPRGTAAPPGGRVRVPAGRGQDAGRLPGRRRRAGRRRRGGHRVGRPGGGTARRGHAGRRGTPPPGRHRRGRRAPRGRRCLPARCHVVPGGVDGLGAARHTGARRARASSWPREGPTPSWPVSGSTAPASPRACGGPGSARRPHKPPTDPATASPTDPAGVSPCWRRAGARSRSRRSRPRSTHRRRPRTLPARRGPSAPTRRSGCSRR